MLKFLVYFNNLDGREQVAGQDREGYGGLNIEDITW